jgi:hypothetical protein
MTDDERAPGDPLAGSNAKMWYFIVMLMFIFMGLVVAFAFVAAQTQ